MDLFIERHGACRPRARSLAVALATAFGSCAVLSAPQLARADVAAVTNCDDAGAGSLRDAVATAASGDTIDFSGLACATITLSSGAIAVAQQSLTLKGPGQDALTIDGAFQDRVLLHTGTGSLSVQYVTLSDGYYFSDTDPAGACIASNGNVLLAHATVSDCFLDGTGNTVARGGGISANGNLVLVSSRVTGNTVASSGDPISNSTAGGAWAQGAVVVKYSTLSGNRAVTLEGHNSGAGALFAYDSTSIVESTISGNYAKFFGAILLGAAGTATITNSTISGNSAFRHSAIYTQAPLTVSNSTIAFNHNLGGGGALFSNTDPIELQSTIVSGNARGGGTLPDDVDGTGGAVVTGGDNIIVSSTIPVPGDTISSCAHLMPLDDNGGPTRTHGLNLDSPAIDHGNNLLDLDTDQRGGARVVGIAADIGALEWSNANAFGFRSGFEPVCDG